MVKTDSTDGRAIVVDYHLAGPPVQVWRALTDPAALQRWLMPNDIAPVVGHRFTFRTQPAPGFDGIVHCEVLEVINNERLVYSWRGGPLETVVTWTLSAGGDGGTILQLVQDGFKPSDGFTYDMLSKGWRDKAPDALEKVVEDLGS
jgi:uncharacterized protein YndB with AHSA1/START domain